MKYEEIFSLDAVSIESICMSGTDGVGCEDSAYSGAVVTHHSLHRPLYMSL